MDTGKRPLLKERLKEYSIAVSAFWCGWAGPVIWDFYDGQLTLGLVPPEYRQMRIQNLCDGADFAHSLGVSDVVTHMGFIPENPNDPNFHSFCVAVRTVAQHLKKTASIFCSRPDRKRPSPCCAALRRWAWTTWGSIWIRPI